MGSSRFTTVSIGASDAIAGPPPWTYIPAAAGTTLLHSHHMRGRPRYSEAETPMAWLYLLLAGLSEVGWAVGLKYTHGFTRTVPSLLTIGSMIVSLGLLGLALKTLPLGTAYAIWTGIGTLGTALLGILLFNEPATTARLLCIALIVAGLVGLKLVTPT
jgi:quaternary ammonium compound-resistance protein SugE